ncbi:MAG: DUF922 domain-containing protein [Bdellovibrionales bacterium]|nr:DUF922 domain-containing protein [Bdellovibrionales bacterium]
MHINQIFIEVLRVYRSRTTDPLDMNLISEQKHLILIVGGNHSTKAWLFKLGCVVARSWIILRRRYFSAPLFLCLILSLFLPYALFAQDSLHDMREQESSVVHSGIALIPGVEIQYYPVSGMTLDEISRSMKRNGPQSSNGVHRAARVQWRVSWHWRERGHKSDTSPDFSSLRMDTSIKMVFPILINRLELPAQDLREWERFSHSLARHEKIHIWHVITGTARIKSEILQAFETNRDLSAREANSIGKRILEEIRTLDYEFDKTTMHGQSEGVILSSRHSFGADLFNRRNSFAFK